VTDTYCTSTALRHSLGKVPGIKMKLHSLSEVRNPHHSIWIRSDCCDRVCVCAFFFVHLPKCITGPDRLSVERERESEGGGYISVVQFKCEFLLKQSINRQKDFIFTKTNMAPLRAVTRQGNK